MSDLAATNCGCGSEVNSGCSSIIWILLLLCFCGGNKGTGFNNGSGCGCDNIWIILLLLCCCGGNNGGGCGCF